MARVFGEIAGNPPGTTYSNRRALAQAGVHKPLQHGISGASAEGADSIVVSGGYEDDEDYGSLIVYTGAGGRDPDTGQQIADQEFTAQNLALVKSYRFVELAADGTPLPAPDNLPSTGPAPRAESTVQRIVRNTEISRRVKALHDYTCQVCGVRIEIAAGAYAEGAHIRPLGRPHDGPDVEGNILCLCPNDHVRFEFGAILIEDDLRIRDSASGAIGGILRTVAQHTHSIGASWRITVSGLT